MKYLSVCSGIESATVAWHQLGWTPIGFSEIEPFPSAVLAERFPNVHNYGDMTKYETWKIKPGSFDLLVGGTPCQSFSVAGLRGGLADPRGNLMFTYLKIAERFKPKWIVWENVPGVLSSNGGKDFGSFVGALGELGYGWAYRILDAQWVRTQRHPRAVPQRRRRVFVVGCLGDERRAAQVLFERESVQRNPSTRRAKGQGVAADVGGCTKVWPAKIASTLNSSFGSKLGLEDQHTLGGAPLFVPQAPYWDGGQCASALTRKGCDDRMPDKQRLFGVLEPVGTDCYNGAVTGAVAATVGTPGSSVNASGPTVAVPYDLYQITAPINRQNRENGDPCHTLARDNAAHAAIAIQGSLIGRDAGGPQGIGVNSEGAMYTLTKGDQHGVAVIPINDRATRFAGKRGNKHDGSGNRFGVGCDGDPCPTITGGDKHSIGVAPTITASNDTSRSPQSAEITQQVAAVYDATMIVRRLTPRECERLMGFPDDWTRIPYRGKDIEQCPDGVRYKSLGNSMAVNCMEWIGERIQAITSLTNKESHS